MKKTILFFAITLLSLCFVACGGDSSNKKNFAGCWQGEADLIFEVIQDGDQYIIRNINGDLTATQQDGKICGKNSLNMEYCMSVDGDAATYEFGGIVTTYKRISKEAYDKVFATQTKATFKGEVSPVTAQ